MITVEDYNFSKTLKGKDKKAFEKREQSDELSYLSSIAFEQFAVSTTDIDNLNYLINKKVGVNKVNHFNTIFISVLCGLLIGVSVFFVLFNKSKNHASVFQVFNEEPFTKKLNNAVLPTDTVFPEIKQIIEKKSVEHFAINETVFVENAISQPLETIDTKAIPAAIAEADANQELVLKFSPNAPVVFISNLKVTNYRLYYFKHNQGVDLFVNAGLAAQYENNNSIDNSKLNKSNAYYAHKIIQRAMAAFNTKNVSTCVEELLLLYNFNKNDANAQFYLGLCYYQLGKYQVAQSYFAKNRDNENNIFHQESEFYEALCMLANKQIEQGRAQMQIIIDGKGFYGERAKLELFK